MKEKVVIPEPLEIKLTKNKILSLALTPSEFVDELHVPVYISTSTIIEKLEDGGERVILDEHGDPALRVHSLFKAGKDSVGGFYPLRDHGYLRLKTTPHARGISCSARWIMPHEPEYSPSGVQDEVQIQ